MKWHEPKIFEEPDGTYVWEVTVSYEEDDGEAQSLAIRSETSFLSQDLAFADCALYIEEHEMDRLS